MALSDCAAELRNVSCQSPGKAGLTAFTMRIARGEIHALVGDAGSGAETVCAVLSGAEHLREGSVTLGGRDIRHLGGSIQNLVKVVDHQLPLVKQATVFEHFFFAGCRAGMFWFGDRRRAREAVHAFLGEHGIVLDTARPVSDLDAPDRHFLHILVSLFTRPALLILHNSLQELRLGQKYTLIEMVKDMAEEGLSVLLAAPLFDEVLDYADTITIVRNGECVLSSSKANLDRMTLLEAAYKQASSAEPRTGSREPDTFRRHMQYYVALMSNYPKPFLIVNMLFEIEIMNGGARELFGISGNPYRSLENMLMRFFPDDAQSLLRHMRENGQTSQTGISTSLGGQNRVINFFSCRVGEGDRDIGAIIIFDDVTERARIQEQMLLAEKVASLGILTAGMAHEINHPLSTINNIVEYLKVKFHEPELLRELHEIQEEVENISGIIRNLAGFSQPVREERVDLHRLIRELVTMIRHYAETTGISIETDLGDFDCVVTADRGEMRQVLLNLISNSIWSIRDAGRVGIATSLEGRRIRLEVSDNGCGMSQETLKNIFLPFYSRRAGKGMGLGLYIAYNIIENHGGTIDVESKVGEGSKFTLSFDAAM